MSGFAGHGPRAVTVAAVLATGALLIFAVVMAQVHARVTGASAAANAAAEELARARDMRDRLMQVEGLWEEPLRHYRALVTEGVVGEVNHPARVAALRGVAETFALPSLRYRIDPPDTVVADGGIVLRRAAMELEFIAVHEGVVPAVLDRLARAGQGRAVPRRCHLERVRERTDDGAFPGIQVRCALDWYTIDAGMHGS